MRSNNSSKTSDSIMPDLCPLPSLLCEQQELQEITGNTLRPGGTELTCRAMQLCNLTAGSTILDVGCGYGETVALLASRFQLQPTGLDPAKAMLGTTAQRCPSVPLVQADAGSIPFHSNFFDALISECVLSLTGNISQSLQEMRRVLAPGGLLVLSDIYVRKENFLPGELRCEMRSCFDGAVSIDILRKFLQEAGFSILHLEDHTRLLRQLAGQIIFSYGSLASFWQLFMGKERAGYICTSLAKCGPGYYLLIAEKE